MFYKPFQFNGYMGKLSWSTLKEQSPFQQKKKNMYQPFLSTTVQQSTILQFKNKYQETGKEKKVKSAGVSTYTFKKTKTLIY